MARKRTLQRLLGRPAGERTPERREKLTRGENPVMIDGMLGDRIDRGVERMNPEGSVDISNKDYREE